MGCVVGRWKTAHRFQQFLLIGFLGRKRVGITWISLLTSWKVLAVYLLHIYIISTLPLRISSASLPWWVAARTSSTWSPSSRTWAFWGSARWTCTWRLRLTEVFAKQKKNPEGGKNTKLLMDYNVRLHRKLKKKSDPFASSTCAPLLCCRLCLISIHWS
jgi:hypothetical protein